MTTKNHLEDFPAPGNQGESAANSKPLTKTNTRALQSAAGLSLGSGEPTCAPRTAGAGAGQFRGFGFDRPDRTPERIAKAQAFQAMVVERRKDKTLCPRCGGPRGDKYRTCDRCRDKVRKAKLRARGVAVVKGGEYSNADLAGMVIQMRREMDRMQARFKLWQKASDYRRNLHYRTNTMRKKYHKPVSHAEAMDYLAGSNHAYEKV